MVLVGRDGARRVLTGADQAALRAGLRVGMPATKAQALVLGLVIKDQDPDADTAALDRLGLWAMSRYAPITAVDGIDGLVIDTTGADHLRGGEPTLLEDLVGRLEAIGVSARAAVSDTWGAANGFARFACRRTMVVEPGESGEALKVLPTSALRLAPPIIDGLRVLGFDRIGDLASQPRAPLALRFGPELGRRLDQAFGRLAEPIVPIRPTELIEARRGFAEPISSAETIARSIGKLVVELCASLEARGLGAKRLDLVFGRVDAHQQAIRVGTSTPIRDVKRLTRLLCDKIDTVDPGFGIETMSLVAVLAEPIENRQRVSSLVEEEEADISALIDILTNRVGESCLYRFAPVPSDVPERSITRVEPMAPDDGRDWPGHWPRPTRLLLRPEEITTVALLPDHPPVSFTWRGIRRRVRRADGPERVFGEWWKRDVEVAAVRDYFQVEDDAGERFWIYRAGDGERPETGSHRWFLHGIFG